MKLGIFQSAGAYLSPEMRFDELHKAIADAELDMVICPELFASGYNVGEQLRDLAQPPDGLYFQLASKIALDTATAIIFGYPEYTDGVLYNSAAFILDDGTLAANHRKCVHAPESFEAEYFTLSDARPELVDFKGIKIGLLICYEVEFAEAVRQLAVMGAHLVAVPTALDENWAVVAENVIRTRALENGIWVAYANHAGEENRTTYLGSSSIVAPLGEVMAAAGNGQELIVAEIEVDQVQIAQGRLPYLQDRKAFIDVINSWP